MKFCRLGSRATLVTKFLSHTHRQRDRQTDRHFSEIVQSCSGHPKTCQSIKNRKSKNCAKAILSPTYIEENKNGKAYDVYYYYIGDKLHMNKNIITEKLEIGEVSDV